MDDELNLLPISNHVLEIQELKKKYNVNLYKLLITLQFEEENIYLSEREKELKKLKTSLKDKAPVGNLIATCKTIDQAKCVLDMVSSISEKVSNNTVSITAGRGRVNKLLINLIIYQGKSSAMGLAVSSAIVYGYSNIFVTAPSPENLKTFFEFVIIGLKNLNYRDKIDFDISYGEKDLKNIVTKIVIFRDHKQTINYIEPTNFSMISHAEIVVIDEAAAIPLHIIKSLIGQYIIYIKLHVLCLWLQLFMVMKELVDLYHLN